MISVNGWVQGICSIVNNTIKPALSVGGIGLFMVFGIIMMGFTFGSWICVLASFSILSGVAVAMLKHRLSTPRGAPVDDGVFTGRKIKCVVFPDDLYSALEKTALRRRIDVRKLIIEIIRDSIILETLLTPVTVPNATSEPEEKQ